MTLTEQAIATIAAGCEGVQGGPWKLDKFACHIWAPSEKGGDFPLTDEIAENGHVLRLRGWGYYTGHGNGALGLPPDEAVNRQRLTGTHIARLDPATVLALCALAQEALQSRREGQQMREVSDERLNELSERLLHDPLSDEDCFDLGVMLEELRDRRALSHPKPESVKS